MNRITIIVTTIILTLSAAEFSAHATDYGPSRIDENYVSPDNIEYPNEYNLPKILAMPKDTDTKNVQSEVHEGTCNYLIIGEDHYKCNPKVVVYAVNGTLNFSTQYFSKDKKSMIVTFLTIIHMGDSIDANRHNFIIDEMMSSGSDNSNSVHKKAYGLCTQVEDAAKKKTILSCDAAFNDTVYRYKFTFWYFWRFIMNASEMSKWRVVFKPDNSYLFMIASGNSDLTSKLYPVIKYHYCIIFKFNTHKC